MTVIKAKGSSAIILLAAFIFAAGYNLAFFQNVLGRYPFQENLAFFISLAILLFCTIAFFLGVVLTKLTFKPVLMLLFPFAAAGSYFMNNYNVIIDASMLQNTLMTDSREVADLLNLKLVSYVLVLGILPAFAVYRFTVPCLSLRSELRARGKMLGVLLLVIVANLLLLSEQYTGFIREEKDLRYYMNPLTLVYSASKLVDSKISEASTGPREVIGEDARVARRSDQRKLVVLVVGEATRADHWSLNGYGRDTNAPLAPYAVVNFPEVSSCATSTAYSLPCMFSLDPFEDFTLDRANGRENVLDVLQRAGVNVLWRDNNSDSKGVAVNIPFEDFRHADVNPVCDEECRDVGMLSGLDDYLQAHPEGDIVIVMHQMGNHGPAYYKRYPKAFERYTPVCQTNQIEECSQEEITNAYDNALLYSNYFLASVIEFLTPRQEEFATALYYMADHGESLGEMGLYLHGLPYAIAPSAQKHVASLMWLGEGFEAQRERLLARAAEPASHDNYFHTVLGLLNISTRVHDPDLDLLASVKGAMPGG